MELNQIAYNQGKCVPDENWCISSALPVGLTLSAYEKCKERNFRLSCVALRETNQGFWTGKDAGRLTNNETAYILLEWKPSGPIRRSTRKRWTKEEERFLIATMQKFNGKN